MLIGGNPTFAAGVPTSDFRAQVCRPHVKRRPEIRLEKSLIQHLTDGLSRNAQPLAKLVYRDSMMPRLLERRSDAVEDMAAVSFTAARNALHIFGINTKTDFSGFHGLVFFGTLKF